MSRRSLVPPVLGVPLAFAALKLLLHALAITNYGYFRDELYYIACSKHLAWGYVDQPPFSIAVLAVVRAVLGESLVALRLLPALCGAATVVLTGMITTRLGGGRVAQALACLCAVVAPVWLALDHFYSMNTFDTLFWSVAALLIASGSSRPSYLAVAYAPLFAAGGMAIERASSARRRAWLRPVALAGVTLVGAPVVPMGLPLLPVDRLVAYGGALGLRPRAQERTREGHLPQVFADMFGWEDLVRRVARVYHALPTGQRATCAILATNYGEAGAIDFFGPRYGLPPAISPHNNYWL
jgi:4-amino-4-deoxy-L-arabinose transferase-like glycosyltransferase